jgi:hypothetical protein
MLTLDLEIQNYMYFSVYRSQWRYDVMTNIYIIFSADLFVGRLLPFLRRTLPV